LWLFPAVANANGINQFTLGGTATTGCSPCNVYNTGTATIDFTTLTYGTSGSLTGVFQESYSYNGGNPTITFSEIGGTLGTFLTIHETGVLTDPIPASGTSFASVSLYSGVSSIVLSSTFAADLSLPSTTFGPAYVASEIVSTSGSSTSGITSPTTNMTFTPTPEPASFGMLGVALIAGIAARRKLQLNR